MWGSHAQSHIEAAGVRGVHGTVSPSKTRFSDTVYPTHSSGSNMALSMGLSLRLLISVQIRTMSPNSHVNIDSDEVRADSGSASNQLYALHKA